MNQVIAKLEENPTYLQANWSLPKEAARFLYLLVRIGRFQRLLEVGTSVGYSTLHMALAASRQQGHVTTIDASAERQQQAESNLQQAGLIDAVSLRTGDALAVMRQLAQEGRTFDFIFLDARKSEYGQYLDFAEQWLEPGGVLLADNTRSHRDEMLDFIERIHAAPQWEASDMETPNGFILARKLENHP